MPKVALGPLVPKVPDSVFLAPTAYIIGDVEIGERSSLFFGTILRGDLLPLRVGEDTNLQEHVMVHTTNGRSPAIIGSRVTVGHRAILHGCTVSDEVLIGMGATVLDEVVIGEHCIIGAGALVTEGKVIPPRSLVMGVPGRVVRALDYDEIIRIRSSAASYVQASNALRQALANNPSIAEAR